MHFNHVLMEYTEFYLEKKYNVTEKVNVLQQRQNTKKRRTVKYGSRLFPSTCSQITQDSKQESKTKLCYI